MLQKTLVLCLSWTISSGACEPPAPEGGLRRQPVATLVQSCKLQTWLAETGHLYKRLFYFRAYALITRVDAEWKS